MGSGSIFPKNLDPTRPCHFLGVYRFELSPFIIIAIV
jgi:hypothetical protein